MSNDTTDNILREIHERIVRYEMIGEGQRCLVAVSGGPDSMVLLHVLVRLCEDGRLKAGGLYVGHLNHNLRGEDSDGDAEFVLRQGRQLGLEVIIGSVDIRGKARQSGESIESTARQERYRFLAETAGHIGCKKIALAHNADDNVETILQRIIRGTGFRGLAGIPPVRPLEEFKEYGDLTLIRPLLGVGRGRIETFLKESDIPFRLDRSNLADDYTRNRIRNELLPLLRERYNPEISQALERLGVIAGWFSELSCKDAQKELAGLIKEQTAESLILDAATLNQKSHIQQAEILYQSLLALHVPQRHIGFKQVHSVLSMLGRDDHPPVLLPSGVQVKRRRGDLIIVKNFNGRNSPNAAIAPPEPIELIVPGRNNLEQGFFYYDPQNQAVNSIESLQAELLSADGFDMDTFITHKNVREEVFDRDKIQAPLTVRVRHEGDRFEPLGLVKNGVREACPAGTKKLGDMLTDDKVPLEMRDKIGLVCDGRGIIWVMGLRIAERVKVSHLTREILKLEIG
ncbi:MAG: tRNA lysidine(34) synthetase TilS [Sedimentisphaerales bacterium]|nr:tRNA lysidine(34) synthetase TilS [Sedimentisphaerales bacterium]